MTQTSSHSHSHPSADDERTWWAGWCAAVIVSALVLIIVIQAFVARLYVIPSASMEPTLHGCDGCANDKILVEKVSDWFGTPAPGDVIVFAGTDSWNTDFYAPRSENVFIRGLQNLGAAVGVIPQAENILVKRVIATGGHTVQCLAGDAGVKVDGALIASDYTALVTPPSAGSAPADGDIGPGGVIDPQEGSLACGGKYFGPVTVPPGHLWVMGDNRTNSRDSRAYIGDQYQGTIPVDNVRGRVVAVVLPPSRAHWVKSADLDGVALAAARR